MDTLYGGTGADSLSGGAGNDVLLGGGGLDTLDGGDDADRLTGGAQGDLLRGGAGNDVFLFGTGHGQDTIADWSDMDISVAGADDLLDLTGFGSALIFRGTDALVLGGGPQLNFAVTGGGDVLVSIDNTGDAVADSTILLVGATNLDASDFLFFVI